MVSLPGNTGISYSGNEDTESRWIKQPGTRVVNNFPKHIREAFFLRQGDTQPRKISTIGEVFLTAWDYNYEDNAGYYRVYIRLIKAKTIKTPAKKGEPNKVVSKKSN